MFHWVNTILGNVKTSLSGAYHAFGFSQYAERYLGAIAYRFNCRFDSTPCRTACWCPPWRVAPAPSIGSGWLKLIGNQEKKEPLGTLHRSGRCYSTAPQAVFDHDSHHLANGMLVPQGVYDIVANIGFITLGTSRETSAFVCDAIALAWEVVFRPMYPGATELMLLCDCGGANAARSPRFQEDLIELVGRLGLRPRVYPIPRSGIPSSTASSAKSSALESGVMLDSPETALKTVERTQTQTGLRVTARILDKAYEIGRKCIETFRDIKDQFIRHDPVLGQWNYVVDANGFD